MKTIVAICIVLTILALAVLAIDAAFPTPGERAARDARAAARAQAAQAWASQAEERASAVTVALWGMVAVTLATVAGVGAALVRLAHLRSQTIPVGRHALYPAVRVGGQWEVMNEPGAQQFAALPQRPTAALARTLLGAPRAPGQAQTQPAVIDASAVQITPWQPRFDLVRSPHFLFAGRTGQGKTNAMMQVAGDLARSYDISWTIAEPGGANWKELATATDIAGIVEAVATVHAEMMHRLDVLRASQANHVAELAAPMPYCGFIIEEAESVYGDLALANRNQARQMAVQLRQVAAMGRKAGIVLMLGAQTALRVVFDGSVLENVGNVYLFGGMQHLAERFRVSRDVRLPDLAPGQAYCPSTGGIVQFARQTQTPALRLALPSRSDTSIATRGDTRGDTAFIASPWPIPEVSVSPEPMPARPEDGINAAQRARIIETYRRTGSLRQTQAELFAGGAGGAWFYFVKSVIQEANL